MAKTEQESTVEAPKKPKAKKRQHGVDHDEEIAQKTFVVETPNEDGEGIKEEHQGLTKAEAEAEKASADAAEAMAVVSLKKSKKRKSNDAKNVKEKRRRTSQSDDEDDADDDDKDGSDDDGDADDEPMEYDLPTANELNAAEQIENATAQETLRQKKKKKHEQRLQELKTHNHDKEKQRNEEYLQKWKYKQEEWKFEKLRQISIQQNVFDEQKISTTLWPIALEYLSGSKGASRQKIIDLANEVIAASDKECNEKTDDEGRQEIVNSARYQRARDLLQSLD